MMASENREILGGVEPTACFHSVAKPITLWFTGLSGSGKSTIAQALHRCLIKLSMSCVVLDGDYLRQGLNNDLGFSVADRSENIRRVAEVAKLFNGTGLTVITALISPMEDDRTLAKSIVGDSNFLEVYFSADLEVCEARDSKGLYAKARSGEILNFTGISAPYQPPRSPSLIVNTNLESVDQVVNRLIDFIHRAQCVERQEKRDHGIRY